MAYRLTYWETAPNSKPEPEQTHYQLKSIRLKSIEEAFTLALPHNRPSNTSLILLERDRNYKGKKWIDEKTVWEKGLSEPLDVIRRPHRTKR